MARFDLLDVNVWLAMVDSRHVHHQHAKAYWHSEASDHICFCRLTMLGLLRLVTNPNAMDGRPFSSAEAWTMYRSYLESPHVKMLAEPSGLERQMAKWSERSDLPNRHWTDCAIASWSKGSGCRLVTFDRGFQRFDDLDVLFLNP